SRGDYPFTTFTGGCDETFFGSLVWSLALKVRKNGQGHKGHKRPAIFPKLVFLYTKDLHGEGKPLHWLYKEGIECSAKAMYPDWLSLDIPDESLIKGAATDHFEPSIAKVFHKYHKFGVSRWYLDENNCVKENPEWVDSIISPMGCRAYLSPYYERGKLSPADENDRPVFTGRFNGGAVSLNLPMILRKAQLEGRDFYEVLDYYLDVINGIHIKTFDFLSKIKATSIPVAYSQGGFAYLKPADSIKPLVERATFSYGFTALNELQELYNGHSLYEEKDNEKAFAYEVLKHIVAYVDDKKAHYGKDIPYIAAIYGTPAESLCGTQVEQFKRKYGIIPKVSDRAYFTNSFHMHVSEEITPFQKQDAEFRYFHLASGGHIQYCRFTTGMNENYISQCVDRAMKLGYYFGVNIEKSYCNDCGAKIDDGIDVCPVCHSHNITEINRVCGYLGYSKVSGDTKMNDAKMAEVHDRKSM
ncbi:MAG: anaerobic ribonucleoside-triphosphate reductase, partial [bacterium]|nr:anaerobic ribonucleoside-triphosphate reductase [bacterium]